MKAGFLGFLHLFCIIYFFTFLHLWTIIPGKIKSWAKLWKQNLNYFTCKFKWNFVTLSYSEKHIRYHLKLSFDVLHNIHQRMIWVVQNRILKSRKKTLNLWIDITGINCYFVISWNDLFPYKVSLQSTVMYTVDIYGLKLSLKMKWILV